MFNLKDQRTDTPFCFLEAGGQAAYSAWMMLTAVKDFTNLCFVDCNPHALRYWGDTGYEYFTEQEFVSKKTLEKYITIPCDEYSRRRYGLRSPFSTNVPDALSSKRDSSWMALRSKLVAVPTIYNNVVIRGEWSSGSKDVTRGLDKVVSEYINADDEWVVDFNTDYKLVFPRKTFCLSRGADTYCELIGKQHPLYSRFPPIVAELTELFGVRGIGNLQLLRKGDKFFFIELSMRFSGCSFLNHSVFKANLFGEEGAMNFESKFVTTRLGFNYLEPV